MYNKKPSYFRIKLINLFNVTMTKAALLVSASLFIYKPKSSFKTKNFVLKNKDSII